jgi:hypothetical protein
MTPPGGSKYDPKWVDLGHIWALLFNVSLRMTPLGPPPRGSNMTIFGSFWALLFNVSLGRGPNMTPGEVPREGPRGPNMAIFGSLFGSLLSPFGHSPP